MSDNEENERGTKARKRRTVINSVTVRPQEEKEGGEAFSVQKITSNRVKRSLSQDSPFLREESESFEPARQKMHSVRETAAQTNRRLRGHLRDDNEWENGEYEEEEDTVSTEEMDPRFQIALSHKHRLDDLYNGGIDWGTTLLRLGVLFACVLAYGYYTYGAIFIIPPVTYKPLYPMMVTDQAYNTTSRPLRQIELDTELIKNKRGVLYISALLKTLKWHARQENYNVVCVHHLAHDLDVHPKVCILHNKFTDQMYSMVNPHITGGSEETQRIAQTSVALGPAKMDFERMLAVQVSYISYPEKVHMYAQFMGPDAATLQLVIDEMEGKMN